MRSVIAAVQGIEVEGETAAEARLESVRRAGVRLARAIDLAAAEIAVPQPAEIALGAGTLGAVLAGAAALETVLVTMPEAPAQVAAEVLRAWAVRVEGLAELAAEVAVVVARVEEVAVVAVVAAVEGSEG